MIKESRLYPKVQKWMRESGGTSVWSYRTSDRFIVGIPDFLGSYKGRMFAIEVKAGSTLRKIQEVTLQDIQEAGGVALVYRVDKVRRVDEDTWYDVAKTPFSFFFKE